MNNYETVFILNPVLSEDQIKETVQKYEKFLTSKGAKIVSKEDWGLKKLAVESNVISNLEVELKRDERFMRSLTVKLDKYAIEWAEKRREKLKIKA